MTPQELDELDRLCQLIAIETDRGKFLQLIVDIKLLLERVMARMPRREAPPIPQTARA